LASVFGVVALKTSDFRGAFLAIQGFPNSRWIAVGMKAQPLDVAKPTVQRREIGVLTCFEFAIGDLSRELTIGQVVAIQIFRLGSAIVNKDLAK
jgi:hypothetical protein